MTRGSLPGVRAASFLYQLIVVVGIPVDEHWNVTGVVSLVVYMAEDEVTTGVTGE